MENMTVNDIVEATGGRLLCGDGATPIAHLSIDSRTMKGQDLFVPLIGEKVDAHGFIGQAFAAGAVAAAMAPRVMAEAMESLSGNSRWTPIKTRSTKTVVMTACRIPMVMALLPKVLSWLSRNSLPMAKAMKPRAA